MAPGPEKPLERLSTFGERFAIVLDHGDGEHAVDEILRSAPGADVSSV
jgi:hypothetical protein